MEVLLSQMVFAKFPEWNPKLIFEKMIANNPIEANVSKAAL